MSAKPVIRYDAGHAAFEMFDEFAPSASLAPGRGLAGFYLGLAAALGLGFRFHQIYGRARARIAASLAW